jgi:hypothetical protein
VLLLAGPAGAGASGGFTSCGSRPARVVFNLEVRAATCAAARKLASHGAAGSPKRVRRHVFRFQSRGWTCLYTVFHSTKAQDSEGEIFDCRKGTRAVAQWSDSPDIQPHSLR